MSRPDASISFLRHHGFSVFRVPRASAQPLELLHRDGKDLTRLGHVPDLVLPGEVGLPDVRRDERPGIDIEGKETSSVNAAIGLSILGAFVGALGGGNVGLQAGFKNARTVTFAYTGVMEDHVDVLALEKYVKAGLVSPHVPSGTLEKLLDDEIYVITSVLKTRKIVVDAQASGGQSVELDVPAIQQVVGASVKLDRQSDRSSRITFEGSVPIAFAFQAVQLVFDDSGEFLTTMQLSPGDAAARRLDRTSAPPVGDRAPVFLQPRGAFARVAP
jgi:hypothetical protein